MAHLQNFYEGYIISLWLDLNKVKCSVGGDGVYCSDNFMQILLKNVGVHSLMKLLLGVFHHPFRKVVRYWAFSSPLPFRGNNLIFFSL